MTDKERDDYLETGFTPDQVDEIQEGLESGLDISVYAKKEFLAIQMRQIRLGLQKNLSVKKYASAEYDWFQMEEIRLGLQDKLDVSVFANPSISYDRMRQIRLGLKDGINLAKYARLDAGILRELRRALISKIHIVEYIQQGYDAEQLEQIRIALEKGVNIVPYLHIEFRGVSIGEICEGLEKGLDVSFYARVELSWQQMREIRLGLENRVDIKCYSNPVYDWKQMQEIRLGLENGIDISSYHTPMWTAAEMKKKRLAVEQAPVAALPTGETASERFENFSLTVSGDEMEAYIFIPDSSKATKEEVMRALGQYGVRRGILEDEIDKLFKAGNKEKAVTVARGKPPEDGPDGWYEYFFRTELSRHPKLLPDGSVDFQSVEWFELVKEGQRIALYHEAEKGKPGYTVTGKELPSRKGHEKSLLTGKGFKLLDDKKTYMATLSGKIELKDQRIEIDKVLIVDEISLATGNVNFDGSVYVMGNVGTGSLIQATGDVVVKGYIESASIESNGSVLLYSGINGNGVGYIMAHGDVNGKFFESCKVYTKGNIFATYCLNCDLHAEDKIYVTGKEGTLAGGMAYARKGIDVQFAGNHVGLATHLRIGVDDAFFDQKNEVDAKIIEAGKQLLIFQHAYADFQKKYPPEVRNVMEMYLKIENAIYTKEKEISELTGEKNRLEQEMKTVKSAEVLVRDTLYEGTQIQISGKNWYARHVSNVSVKKVGERIAVFKN